MPGRESGRNEHDTLAHFTGTAVAAVTATAAGSFRSLLDGRRRGGGSRLVFGMSGECDVMA